MKVISSTGKTVLNTFKKKFHRSAEYLVEAPGRVNLIGEHTDYNKGFVLPLAIDRVISIALSPITEPEIRLFSLDFNHGISLSLEHPMEKGSGWPEYLKGLIEIFKKNHFEVNGWRGIMAGDIPIGAGLSSSAALEIALSRAFAAVSNWDWNPKTMALISQQVENEWVGIKCGVMDQMISASGKMGHLFFLDCQSLEATHVPLPESVRIVILDTDTRRGLVDSEYNERRNQCESVARYFGTKTLRDVSIEQLKKTELLLNPIEVKRARHVILENKRVIESVEALHLGLMKKVGELMIASHISLRDDFEVSSEALNHIVDCAIQAPGCYGARMTGAGLGGCAVALVESKFTEKFVSQVVNNYHSSIGKRAVLYVCKASDGASVFSKKESFSF